MMTADHPVFGVGLGNFQWAKAFYGLARGAPTHNSYLWALTAGGIGVLALYVLLFCVVYRALKKLERSGPPELLWLSKGLKVNLFLFLVFSAFADFWLSDFLYLLLGLTTCMTALWQRERQRTSQVSSLTVAWQRSGRNLREVSPPLSA
jgi:O-antigen ligase